MKLRHILVTAAAASFAVSTPALAGPHTITWSAQNPGAGLGSTAGAGLAPGTLVRLGYFTISPQEVATAFDNAVYLDSQFVEVARESVGNFGGVLYGNQIETSPSDFDVPGAFAQTITLDSDSVPAGSQFFIWASDSLQPNETTAQALFSAAEWQLSSEQVTAMQWGIESVDPANAGDVYLADLGPETSGSVGGLLNKLRPVELTPSPGDLEDPDGNGIVVLLEEAFLATAPATAHANMPYMAASDILVYNRKSGGQAVGWDLYKSGDLEYRVEASNDFQNWQLASEVLGEALVAAEAVGTGGERVAVKFPTTTDGLKRLYFRVHVHRVTAINE